MLVIDFSPLDSSDYQSVTQMLTFGPGNKQSSVTIPIVNDNIDETIEQFFITITLVTTDVNVEISPEQTTIQINDDDGDC